MNELDVLRDQVQHQRERLAAQEEVILGLEDRLAHLEREDDRPAPQPSGPSSPPDAESGTGRTLAPVTDRRHLIGTAATAAAAAVVGGSALALAGADPAEAAQGIFTGNPGVSGVADPDYATGVYGGSSSGSGVSGQSSSGPGVVATTNSGVHLRLAGSPVPPEGSSGYHMAGDLVRDNGNDLWLCVAGGTPGLFRRLAGPSTAGALVVLPKPVRVYDSRPPFPPFLGVKAPLAAGTSRSCDLKVASSGVPGSAVAAVINLVATGTTGAQGGFLAVYSANQMWGGTSNINWSGPGQNVAVTTLTSVSNGVCTLLANAATDVVVDVIGYYR